MSSAPHVVILGAGFGGLNAARALRRAPALVTLVDRKNHHLFQPLLYQVATCALNPSDIATPIRRIVRHQRNASVVLADATAIDPSARKVTLADGESHKSNLHLCARSKSIELEGSVQAVLQIVQIKRNTTNSPIFAFSNT